MSDPTYAFAIQTFAPTLASLSGVLDKALEHARAAGVDPAPLVNARLAPDMYPLSRQIQVACDHAKSAAARLAGREPPSVPDDEQTMADLKARIAKTIDYVHSIPASAFEGAAERRIVMSLQGELVLDMSGLEYLRDWALPHFYFHVVTAYDILRHNGVEIGKRDFMAHVAYAIRQRESA